MKIYVTYLLIAGLAVAAGFGAAWGYLGYYKSTIDERFVDSTWTVSKASDLSGKAVLLDGSDHDFGELTRDDAAYSHEFLLKNNGDLAMDVWIETPPERPVSVDLTDIKDTIGVGSTRAISVKVWRRNVDENSSFDVKFFVQTNERGGEPIEFNIKGKRVD